MKNPRSPRTGPARHYTNVNITIIFTIAVTFLQYGNKSVLNSNISKGTSFLREGRKKNEFGSLA